MGNLADIPATWAETITQIETGEPVEGGPNGIDNAPHRQLASRTAYLLAQLALKASAAHGHALADITGLVDALAAKAATSHNHALADTNGLVEALAAKAATAHGHALTDLACTEGAATYRLSIVGGVLTQTRIS